jgi:hypothetical protein
VKLKGARGTGRRKAREFTKRDKMESEGMELEWPGTVEHGTESGKAKIKLK